MLCILRYPPVEFTAHECGFDSRIDTLSLGRAVPQSDAVAVNIMQTGSDAGSLPLSGKLFQGKKGKENLSVKARLCSPHVNQGRFPSLQPECQVSNSQKCQDPCSCASLSLMAIKAQENGKTRKWVCCCGCYPVGINLSSSSRSWRRCLTGCKLAVHGWQTFAEAQQVQFLPVVWVQN